MSAYTSQQIFQYLKDKNYIDAGGGPLNPFMIYNEAYNYGVTAPEVDAALGWRPGTAAEWVDQNHLPRLTGVASNVQSQPEAPPVIVTVVDTGAGVSNPGAPVFSTIAPNTPIAFDLQNNAAVQAVFSSSAAFGPQALVAPVAPTEIPTYSAGQAFDTPGINASYDPGAPYVEIPQVTCSWPTTSLKRCGRYFRAMT